MRKWGEKGREERGKRFWGSCACAAAAAHAARTMAYRRGPGGGAFCLSTPYHAERLIQFMARNDLWPFHFYIPFLCIPFRSEKTNTNIWMGKKWGKRESHRSSLSRSREGRYAARVGESTRESRDKRKGGISVRIWRRALAVKRTRAVAAGGLYSLLKQTHHRADRDGPKGRLA